MCYHHSAVTVVLPYLNIKHEEGAWFSVRNNNINIFCNHISWRKYFSKRSKQFSMGWMKSKMILLFLADGLVSSHSILATHDLTNINIPNDILVPDQDKEVFTVLDIFLLR